MTTTADEYDVSSNGQCALREAVDAANTNTAKGGCPTGETAPDTINIPAGIYTIARGPVMPYNNSNGDINVAGTVTLAATGKVVIDGNNVDRVLTHQGAGTLKISNLTIRGGRATGVPGGGIFQDALGNLELNQVTVTGNSTNLDGGGIANQGQASVFVNVTLTGNQAGGSGGGLYNSNLSQLQLRNSTVAGNTADADAAGGGDGGGFFTSVRLIVSNSIIANNSDSSPLPADQKPDCSSSTAELFLRFTLVENYNPATCINAGNTTSDIFGQDPNLGTLADNGGPVPTLALASGSIAIDKANNSDNDTCPPTDARGITRPQGAACDLGAFERAPSDDPPGPGPGPGPEPGENRGTCASKTATITGTGARDVIKGTAKRDIIAALGGNDKVTGLGGNDLICGGAGKDALSGGKGKDTLKGDAGNDKLLGGAGRDILQGAKGVDKLFGGPAKDKLSGGAGKDVQKQ